MKFLVLRRHRGDRDYRPGDEREASESDVAHLVRAGVLRRKEEPQAKAEEDPQNKAEAAPMNKAEESPKRRKKRRRAD